MGGKSITLQDNEQKKYRVTYVGFLFIHNNLLSHINEIRNLHLYDRPIPTADLPAELEVSAAGEERSVSGSSWYCSSIGDGSFRTLKTDSEIEDDDDFRRQRKNNLPPAIQPKTIRILSIKDQKSIRIAESIHKIMIAKHEKKDKYDRELMDKKLDLYKDNPEMSEELRAKYDQDRDLAKRELERMQKQHRKKIRDITNGLK
jgi:hypothetical protein